MPASKRSSFPTHAFPLARAFSQCGDILVDIPDSVKSIEKNAFSGSSAVIRCNLHSFAYEYAREQQIDFILNGDYLIETLTVADQEIALQLSAAEQCTVCLEVRDDLEETVLFSDSSLCGADSELQEVYFPYDALPQNFVLYAVLRDDQGRDISKPQVNRHYSSAYTAYEQQTMADFGGGQVLDFGSDGYGVLDDQVTVISGAVSQANGTYTFMPGGEIREGDCLLLNNEPVMVKTCLKNADGSVTVTKDEEAGIADFYQYLRVESTMDAANAVGAVSAKNEMQNDTIKLTELKHDVTVGPLKASIKATVSIHYKLEYSKAHFGEDYFEMESYTECKGSGEVSVTVLDNDSLTIPLLDADVPTAVPGVTLNAKVSIPIEVKGSGTYGVSFTVKSGTSFNPIDGETPIRSSHFTPKLEVKAELEGKVGFDAKFGLKMMGCIYTGLDVQFGAKISAKNVVNLTSHSKKHGCSLCLDSNVAAYLSSDFEISYKIGKSIKGDILKVSLGAVESSVFDGYFSVINDKDSLFGGVFAKGEGECPNYKYLVTVNTYDQDGEKVSGIGLDGFKRDSVELDPAFTGSSSFTTYLYPGNYRVIGYFENANVSQSFSVMDDAVKVDLYLKSYPVLGSVTDIDTKEPIQGADISVTLLDGTVCHVLSDEKGEFEFSLPQGAYVFKAKHTEYADGTSENIRVGEGLNATVSISMKQAEVQVVGRVTRSSDLAALSGASVLFEGPKTYLAITGADGRYKVSVRAGDYTVKASAQEYKSQWRTETMSAGFQKMVNFCLDELEEKCVLTGRVVCEEDNQPLSGARVECAVGEETFAAVTDESGNYKMNIVKGQAEITVSCDGYDNDSAEKWIEGDCEHNAALKKRVVGNCLLKVIDSRSGETLDGLLFSLKDAEENAVDMGEIVRQGEYYQFSARAGEYTLTVEKQYYKPSNVTLTIEADTDTTETVRMQFDSASACEFVFIIAPGVPTIKLVAEKSPNQSYVDVLNSVMDQTPIDLAESVHDHFVKWEWNLGYYDIRNQVYALWETEDGFQFAYKNESGNHYKPVTIKNTLDIVRYVGTQTEVYVPTMIDQVEAGEVRMGAFSQTDVQFVSFPDSVYLDKNTAGITSSCHHLTDVRLPDGIKYIPTTMFGGCENLKTFKIPDTVQTIYSHAFDGTGLTSIVFPAAVTSAETYAFSNCKDLKSAVFQGEYVYFIGGSCFANCTSLEYVQMPSKMNYIGGDAFLNCTTLTSIVIPENTFSIGARAFKGCTSLQEITIPKSVTTMTGPDIFNGCTSLKTVYTYKNSKAAEYIGTNCPNVAIVYLDADTGS